MALSVLTTGCISKEVKENEVIDNAKGTIKTVCEKEGILVVYDEDTLVMYASISSQSGVGEFVRLIDRDGRQKLFDIKTEKQWKEDGKEYFILIEENRWEYEIVCDDDTKVIYLIRNSLVSNGDLSLMLDENGKPKLCE